MALVQDRCICLRKLEYSESSQILTLFGYQHGVVRVLAKGSHRTTRAGASRFSGGIDLLDLGEAVFTDRPDRNLATLTEWTLCDGHLHLRRSLRAVFQGIYAAELVSLLIEQWDPHPALFERLERTVLELGTPTAEQAFLAFELELLRQAGYLPEFARCAGCGQEVAPQGIVSFDASAGGLVCRNCQGAFPQRMTIDGRLVGIIRYVLGLLEGPASLPILTRQQTDPINGLIAAYVQQIIGKKLRTAGYVTGPESLPAR